MIPLQSAFETRIFCVQLLLFAIISFRAVPRVLKLAQTPSQFESTPWIPHFSSVINWTLRVGLALMNEVKPIEKDWVAIVDFSIDVAIKKVLVVIRVPLNVLQNCNGGISLSDCECIGLEVSESWNGESICSTLQKIFSKAGVPRALISDGGKDLQKGLRLVNHIIKSGKNGHNSFFIINDVGHIIGNALKDQYSKAAGFYKFLKKIKSVSAALRQSSIAFLTPPKLRTKGRFQNITKLAKWANEILEQFTVVGKVKEDSLKGKFRKFFNNLGTHRKFIEDFSFTCDVAEKILKIFKLRGLNQKSYGAAKKLLESLSRESKFRVKMTAWLDKHIRTHCLIGIGQTPLPVSSDIIESLFGKFKTIIARNPKAEFNQIILSIPCLCGNISQEKIRTSLSQVSHTDLLQWRSETVHKTQARQRRVFFNKTKKLEPKTGLAM